MTIQDLVRKLQATNCWAITFIVYSVATLVANYFIQYSHTDLYNNFWMNLQMDMQKQHELHQLQWT